MAFLVKEELKTKATTAVIDLITKNEESTVNIIIDESIDEMKSYLWKYYDANAIFNSEGDARSKVILKHLKSIVIFELYKIRNTQLNEVAEKAYNEAMLWLEKNSTGKIEPDLPKKQVDTDGDGEADSNATFMKLGSRKSYKNHW